MIKTIHIWKTPDKLEKLAKLTVSIEKHTPIQWVTRWCLKNSHDSVYYEME